MTQTSASEAIKYTNMDSETPNVGYVLKAFRKLSIESNDDQHNSGGKFARVGLCCA